MPPRRDPQMSRLKTCLLTILGLATALVTSWLGVVFTPVAAGGGPVLVLVLPWGDTPEQVVLRAGGRMVGPEQAPLSVLAQGATPEQFLAAGAWLVADPGRLPFLCAAETDT